MWETEKFDVAERVAVSKARLSDRLARLADRVDAVREATRPAHIIKQPWFLFAAAGLVGFLAGRHRVRPRAALTGEVRAVPPGITRSLLREVTLAAAAAYARKYVDRKFSQP